MNVVRKAVRTIQVKVMSIRKIEHPRIKALSTIELAGIGRIAGIKVIQGDHNLYCCPPTMSFVEDGLRKWENIITFEQSLWKEIQRRILKKYEELRNDQKRGKPT